MNSNVSVSSLGSVTRIIVRINRAGRAKALIVFDGKSLSLAAGNGLGREFLEKLSEDLGMHQTFGVIGDLCWEVYEGGPPTQFLVKNLDKL